MNSERTRGGTTGYRTLEQRGFTLIELLVVMAIITLLISILLPSLSRAREHSKKVKTQAAMRGIADGLELYRNDNESDRTARATNGYPPSAMGEDPAEAGTQDIAGANWLVRHLMGKDLNGYAPRRNVPGNMQNPGDPAEQVQWYEYNADGTPKVDRVGPYLEGVKVLQTKELPQGMSNPAGTWADQREQQVFIDSFGYPILYYVANAMVASRSRSPVASFDGSEPGIFTLTDNAHFTGYCRDGTCFTNPNPWDYGNGSDHPLGHFGATNSVLPENITNDTKTFPYYILDKDLYDASHDPTNPSNTTAVPHRKNTFLLIASGKDALFGTSDDARNF